MILLNGFSMGYYNIVTWIFDLSWCLPNQIGTLSNLRIVGDWGSLLFAHGGSCGADIRMWRALSGVLTSISVIAVSI